MSVVNLRLARKAKARAEREAAAGTNRSLYGRTRSERTAQVIEASRATRLLDGHKLDVPRREGCEPSPGDDA